ncbi:MAG: metalloregulator ArsR/SmtB family transcription factor [Candidatus Bathyarchaeia archaeon]
MSTTIAQARVKRLVNLGLVDSSCTPAQHITQLRSRLAEDEQTFRTMTSIFSALGDVTRLKILKLIGDEELCSCEVMAALELTQPTTSHHLGILERAGILSSRRNGKWVFYRISGSKTRTLLARSFDLVEN